MTDLGYRAQSDPPTTLYIVTVSHTDFEKSPISFHTVTGIIGGAVPSPAASSMNTSDPGTINGRLSGVQNQTALCIHIHGLTACNRIIIISAG